MPTKLSSGMEIWTFRELAEADFSECRRLREAMLSQMRKLIPLCGSPIERQFLTAWINSQEESGYNDDLFLLAASIELQYQQFGFRADFAFPSRRLWIELDGHQWHSSKEQRTRDAMKDRILQANGWKAFRFTGTEIVRDVAACCQEVEDELFGRNFGDLMFQKVNRC